MTTQTQALSQTRTASGAVILFAAIAGILLVAAAGIAQGSVMHDAAHDQRHAMAFPCH